MSRTDEDIFRAVERLDNAGWSLGEAVRHVALMFGVRVERVTDAWALRYAGGVR